MQTQKFDELISYFNRKVADMSIDTKYKMELLVMVTALGFAHEKELTAQPERTKGHWEYSDDQYETLCCSLCGYDTEDYVKHNYCPHCGAKMTEGDANES